MRLVPPSVRLLSESHRTPCRSRRPRARPWSSWSAWAADRDPTSRPSALVSALRARAAGAALRRHGRDGVGGVTSGDRRRIRIRADSRRDAFGFDGFVGSRQGSPPGSWFDGLRPRSVRATGLRIRAGWPAPPRPGRRVAPPPDPGARPPRRVGGGRVASQTIKPTRISSITPPPAATPIIRLRLFGGRYCVIAGAL